MSKAKKRQVPKPNPYTIADMQKAVDAVEKGSSIFSTSKNFNVPYATLHSRVKGKFPIDTRPGPSCILGNSEEKELVKWIFDMSKCGFPVTKDMLLNTVQNFVIKTGRETPFTNGRPSRHWYKAFLKRNPELSAKVCQNLNKARASVSEVNIRRWFTEIEAFLTSKGITDLTPDRVFNVDESAFLLNPKLGKVLVPRGEKACYNVCGNEKECYTALIGGNAAGSLLPTMIIYNQERISSEISKHFPDDFVLGKSDTGWMTSETFYCYVVNHLYQWCINNNISFPIVLFVDGHSSHLTKALSDFCCEYGIELIALYPNATHIMQPMDVALFHPLKTSYKEAVRQWRMENNGAALGKAYFAKVLKNALLVLDLKTIFKNGFKRCGLYPFSAESINYKKLISSCDDSETSSQPDEKQNKDAADGNSVQDTLLCLELKIDSDVLVKFKKHDCKEWTGELKFQELYKFWLSCCNNESSGDEKNQTTSSMKNDRIETEVGELMSSDSSFLEPASSTLNNDAILVAEIEADGYKYSPNIDNQMIILADSNNTYLINDETHSNSNETVQQISDCEKVSYVCMNECALDLSIVDKHNFKFNNNCKENVTYDQIYEKNVDQECINSTVSVSSQNVYSQFKDCVEPTTGTSELSICKPTILSSTQTFKPSLREAAAPVSGHSAEPIYGSSAIPSAKEPSAPQAASELSAELVFSSAAAELDAIPSWNKPLAPQVASELSAEPAPSSAAAIPSSNKLLAPQVASELSSMPASSSVADIPSLNKPLVASELSSKPASSTAAIPSNSSLIERAIIVSEPSTTTDISISNPTSKAESVFGKNRITGYLFYPQKYKKDKNNTNKGKKMLPPAATGEEWRSYCEVKEKEKEELEKQKEIRKIEREAKFKIKQEIDENLKQLKPKKESVQNQIKELQLTIEKTKAEKRLLEIQLKSKEFQEPQTCLEEKINELKKQIDSDVKQKKELCNTKMNFIQEEKKIKSLNRKPLSTIN